MTSPNPLALAAFRLGSSFNYVKDPLRPNIRGELVYSDRLPLPITTGTPPAHGFDTNEFIQEYRITLDSTVGDFEFGEIALVDLAGKERALHVSPTRLYKFRSTEETPGNTIVISAILVYAHSGFEPHFNVFEFGGRGMEDFVRYANNSDTIALRGTEGTLISNVAAGEINAQSKDAVNGAQFHALQEEIERLRQLVEGP